MDRSTTRISFLAIATLVALVLSEGLARSADTTPPQLTAFQIVNPVIDTSSGDVTVTINYQATDDSSGVQSINVIFDTPAGGNLSGGDAAIPPSTSTTGTVKITVPQFSRAGSYLVDHVNLIDAAGNLKTYGVFALASLNPGCPATCSTSPFCACAFVDNAAVTDTSGPMLTSFSIMPQSIDTSSADKPVTIDYSVTDDLSGIKSITIIFDTPGGTMITASASPPQQPPPPAKPQPTLSWTASSTITVPKFSRNGLYPINTVRLVDVSGNQRDYSKCDLMTLGCSLAVPLGVGCSSPFPPGVECAVDDVASMQDATPPTLTALSVTPSLVDTRTGPATVAITYSATDDLSGIASLIVKYAQTGGGQPLFALDAISSPATSRTATLSLQIPKDAPTGVYAPTSLTLKDASGNQSILDPVSCVPVLGNPVPAGCSAFVSAGAQFQVGNCQTDANCPDGNACTLDVCDTGTGCSHPAKCPAGDQCNAPSVCNPMTGNCSALLALPNGAPCNDGLFCDGTDTCQNGSCTAHSGNPCAKGECQATCNESTHSCSAVVVGAPCLDDGNPCTTDICDATGACIHTAGNTGTVCRPKKGSCDVDETCTGSSSTCPADTFAPAGTVCHQPVGPCDVQEVCDGMSASCPPSAGPGDTDGDGTCNNIDDCTNVAGGRDFLISPSPNVVISKVGSLQRLSLSAVFDIAPGIAFSSINPAVEGARIVLTNSSDVDKVDIHLPPGSYAGHGSRGWMLSASGRMWTFTDTTGSPVDGIVKMTIAERRVAAPIQVKVTVQGKDASYPIVPSDLPIQATVVLGDQSASAAGACGQSVFEADDCALNGSQTRVTCRN